jgi:hypothetical protein
MARAIMGKNGVEVAVLRGVDDDIAYAGLVALLFAQQRCTSEIVPLASSSRDGRRSFQEIPAHAGAR